jgi:hypothetical protein
VWLGANLPTVIQHFEDLSLPVFQGVRPYCPVSMKTGFCTGAPVVWEDPA